MTKLEDLLNAVNELNVQNAKILCALTHLSKQQEEIAAEGAHQTKRIDNLYRLTYIVTGGATVLFGALGILVTFIKPSFFTSFLK